MKKITSLLFVLFFIQMSYAQKLSVQEIFNVYEKENAEEINYFLANKGWNFDGSKKDYPRKGMFQVDWKFNPSYNRISGLFSVVMNNVNIAKVITYSIFDNDYLFFKDSLSTYGFKVVENYIENGNMITIYSNGNYEVSVTTMKIEDNYKKGTQYVIKFIDAQFSNRQNK